MNDGLARAVRNEIARMTGARPQQAGTDQSSAVVQIAENLRQIAAAKANARHGITLPHENDQAACDALADAVQREVARRSAR